MSNLQRFLFGAPARDLAADVALLALRLVPGLTLALTHGIGKLPPSEGFVAMVAGMGFPAPEVAAWGSTIAELAGGLLLAVGLLTRPAALLVVANFLVVVLLAHPGAGFAGRELGLMYLLVGLALALTGAGRFSLDAALSRRPVRSRHDPVPTGHPGVFGGGPEPRAT